MILKSVMLINLGDYIFLIKFSSKKNSAFCCFDEFLCAVEVYLVIEIAIAFD